MTLSILHRLAGVFLLAGLIGWVAWLVSASRGPAVYADTSVVWSSWPWKILAALSAVALIYHGSNGVRHLCWDLGWGLERVQARRSALLVIATVIVLAGVCLYFLFRRGTGAA